MKQMMTSKAMVSVGIYILFACICRSAAAYHFYYLEQWTTFYWDAETMKEACCTPGGLGTWFADFLTQFFCFSAGPMIYALLMWHVFWALTVFPNRRMEYLGILPAIAMLLVQIDSMNCLLNYSLAFTVAILMIAAQYRLLINYWCDTWRSKCIVVIGYSAMFALYTWVFSTGKLYREDVEMDAKGLLPWILVGVVAILKMIPFKRVMPSKLRRKKLLLVVQILLVAAGSAGLFLSSYQAKEEYMKKIYYFVRHQQWDEIISRSRSLGSKDNVSFQLCRNMALAEKGRLGEDFLMYEQQGMNSVMTSDFKTMKTSMVMMDVYYTMGYVNMSQLCAFEAQECMANKSPYLWQRLVDTNLENGAYAVAEKYIKLLESTLAYRSWAKERRKFLYNDQAVNADKVLGLKRKCIFQEDRLMGDGGFDKDLACIVKACPEHRASLEYLGCMYITANQRVNFLALMKKYKGTKAMPRIPASFQKAMEVFEKNPV